MGSPGQPPKGIEPSELWTKLTELPRPLSDEHTVHARKQDVGAVRFRVLTSRELSWVRGEANRATKKVLGDDAVKGNLAYEEELQEQKALHLLALACRRPEDPQFPTFVRAEDVHAELTDDEISVALAAYATFRRESGPYLSELGPEEMEAWIKVLQEGASRFPLARLSGEALTDLVMYLVSKLPTPATDTSSAGSPPAACSIQSDDQ